MSGKNSRRKPYSLSEMKAIVDYLTEHKAYGEVKARKMWIDMQDSKITNRTWQSLKETFLKRILPDIHNPYYKLSLQEISSFKQGYDIQKKINNKLQIRATTPDSNTDGENKNKMEDKTGEDLETSKSNVRSSTETLVLEPINEDVAEKGLKNVDTYSEPLKSMIEAVINDFTTDGEGDGSNDEPKMEIIEVIDNDQSESEDAHGIIGKVSQKFSDDELYNILKGSKQKTTKERNTSSQMLNVSEVNSEKEAKPINPKNSTSVISKTTPNSSNLTTDTFLPGNQEAIEDKLIINDIDCTSKNSGTKCLKRRATSQDTPVEQSVNKKRFLNKNKQSVSDMEIYDTNNKEKVDLSMYRKQKILEGKESSNAKPSNGMNQELLKDKEDDSNNKILIIDEESSPETENACFQSRDADQITPNVENGDKQKLGDNSAKEETVGNVREDDNERVMMKSGSSLSNSTKEAENRRSNSEGRQHRDRALTNLFGFTSGAANRNRKSKNSFRRSRHQTLNISSDSTAWTSDTGSEYISPPRGRKNKHSRKYLKPNSARVLSLEEEGGLFVMYGKKIYPVVKDGKIIKNFVNFIEEDAVDTEESYWKLKYVEEKKKTEELTKLIKQVKEKNVQEPKTKDRSVPTTSLNISSDENQQKSKKNIPANKTTSSDTILHVKQVIDKIKASIGYGKEVPEKDTVKIKFTIKNEAVELVGRSAQVNPLLAHVVHLLQKDPEPVDSGKVSPKCGSVCSEKSSVMIISDQEAKERVNKLESDIFKEIVERDHVNEPHTDEVNRKSNEKDITPIINVVPSNGNHTIPSKIEETSNKIEKTPNKIEETPNKIEETPSENVTKRQGRLTRSTSSTPVKQTPVKKLKTDEESITRRSARTAKKSLTTDNDDGNTSTTKTRQSTARKSLVNKADDSQVKYKFPSPAAVNANNNKKGIKTNKKQRRAKSLSNYKICTSPENASLHSVESTQGYAESDFSPIEVATRKRRTSFTLNKYNNRKLSYRRKKTHSHPYDTSETSNSYQDPIKTTTIHNSSLNSDIYKSESYRQLMNNVSVRNKEKRDSKLEKINEINPYNLDSETLFDINENESSQSKNVIRRTNTDTSSNVTLPTSPVLSIVENISVDKSMLSNSDNFIYQDKELSQDAIEKIMLNEFMKADADVSMPLMEHQYGIQSGAQDGFEYHYTLNDPNSSALPQSLVKQINTVKLGDPTLSETLNDKLRNLLLESNKKKQIVNSNDESNKEAQNDNVKKNKPKKRSSTPRKRQSTRKTKVITEPCIEEEHMETCSQVSRKSCPPNIHIFKEVDNIEGNDSTECVELNTGKSKGKRKKDIIKVKITKPKRKRKETEHCAMRDSVQTDSGINEMESSILLTVHNDSVDLIHNHSDTCLNAYECMGDSIEIIENSTKSIISLDSTSVSINEDEYYSKLPEMMAQELFCNNAQDGTKKGPVLFAPVLRQESDSVSVYQTPVGSDLSPNSLMTEDLSDELLPQPLPNSRWYLFSEDETNTNAFDTNSRQTRSYANLNQIFPVTCAIPDLSTITEMSKENDGNTGKLSDDTRNDLDSQTS